VISGDHPLTPGIWTGMTELNSADSVARDRRLMRRFEMCLPAVVRPEGAEAIVTETRNISARGVFFYLDRKLAAGTAIEMTLTFPPHVTLTEPMRVKFLARVIRVEPPLPSARIGIAAMIEDYQYLQTEQAAVSIAGESFKPAAV
jgi:PilZ domain